MGPSQKEVTNSLNISEFLMMVNSLHPFRILSSRGRRRRLGSRGCLKGGIQSWLRADKRKIIAPGQPFEWQHTINPFHNNFIKRILMLRTFTKRKLYTSAYRILVFKKNVELLLCFLKKILDLVESHLSIAEKQNGILWAKEREICFTIDV